MYSIVIWNFQYMLSLYHSLPVILTMKFSLLEGIFYELILSCHDVGTVIFLSWNLFFPSLYFQILHTPQGRLKRPKFMWKFPSSFLIGNNSSFFFLTSSSLPVLHFGTYVSSCIQEIIFNIHNAWKDCFTSVNLEEKSNSFLQ